MTVSSTTNVAGPFSGNGVTTNFPFSFRVNDGTWLEVTHTDSAGVETVLGSSTYTVNLNSDQENDPGGSVDYPNSGGPLPTGEYLTIRRIVPATQAVDLVNQGAWLPEVVETSLDKLTMMVQQNQEELARSIQVPLSGSTDPDDLRDNLLAAEAASAASAAAAAASESSAAASEAAAAASYDSFDDRYLGQKATPPTLDNDGDPLVTGAMYFNTTDNNMYVRTASATWATVNNLASATNAANSAAAAAASETNAAASESAAAASAAAAAISETNAATSETNAAASESAAAASESAASASEAAAAASEAAAAASYDNFDDRYLGPKASAPTLDNDGNPLVAGAMYYNTTDGDMYVRTASSTWVTVSNSTSATNAANSAAAAATSASNAAVSESNAAASEAAADADAAAAAVSEANASVSASNASTSASNASTSEVNAATSASNASTSASNAAASEAAAAASYDSFDDRYLGPKATPPTLDNDGNPLVTGALYFNTTDNEMYVRTASATWVTVSNTTSATNAANSAAAAAASESNAAASETNAAASEAAAAISESNAATSASNASTSASSASTSETNAAASAAAAATSYDDFDDRYLGPKAVAPTLDNDGNPLVTGALYFNTADGDMYVRNAAAAWVTVSNTTSATDAANSAAAAEASYDSFDDRYLGPKASDPTLDNDGDALLTGALYFNTTLDAMMVYNGSTWVAAYVGAGDYLLKTNNLGDLTNVPTARSNLGLGGAAVLNVGTAAGTVAAGDHDHNSVYGQLSALNAWTNSQTFNVAGTASLNVGNTSSGGAVYIGPSATRVEISTTGAASYIDSTSTTTLNIRKLANSQIVNIQAYDSTGTLRTVAQFGGATPSATLLYGGAVRLSLNAAGHAHGISGVMYQEDISRLDTHGSAVFTHTINYKGKDSIGNDAFYGRIRVYCADATDGSEDGIFYIGTQRNGSLADRMYIGDGLVVGSPTDGDKGAGTINATSLYENGTLLTAKYGQLSTTNTWTGSNTWTSASIFDSGGAISAVNIGPSSNRLILQSQGTGTNSYLDDYTTAALYIRKLANSQYIYLQARDSGGTVRTVARFGGTTPLAQFYCGADNSLLLSSSGAHTYSNAATCTLTSTRIDTHGSAVDVMSGAYNGKSSTGVTRQYARVRAHAQVDTNTAEDGLYYIGTIRSGTFGERLYVGAGLVVGSPTGGDKGAGTINATAVYDDDVLLTDYVFDHYLTGRINPDEAKQAEKFLSNTAITDVDCFADFWKEARHLPSMPSREEFTRDRMSIGKLAQRLWETVELQAIHIESLNQRIKQLEVH